MNRRQRRAERSKQGDAIRAVERLQRVLLEYRDDIGQAVMGRGKLTLTEYAYAAKRKLDQGTLARLLDVDRQLHGGNERRST